jgi:hypothetical protein
MNDTMKSQWLDGLTLVGLTKFRRNPSTASKGPYASRSL